MKDKLEVGMYVRNIGGIERLKKENDNGWFFEKSMIIKPDNIEKYIIKAPLFILSLTINPNSSNISLALIYSLSFIFSFNLIIILFKNFSHLGHKSNLSITINREGLTSSENTVLSYLVMCLFLISLSHISHL